MADEKTLKPLNCPFCDKKPHVDKVGKDGMAEMIECLTEGCVNPHISYYGVNVARTKWNTRPASTPAIHASGDVAEACAAVKKVFPKDWFPCESKSAQSALVYFSPSENLGINYGHLQTLITAATSSRSLRGSLDIVLDRCESLEKERDYARKENTALRERVKGMEAALRDMQNILDGTYDPDRFLKLRSHVQQALSTYRGKEASDG